MKHVKVDATHCGVSGTDHMTGRQIIANDKICIPALDLLYSHTKTGE